MSQYRGRHRAGDRHRAKQKNFLLEHPIVPVGAIATVAIGAGAAAVITDQAPAAASAVNFISAAHVNVPDTRDRAGEQAVSRSNARTSAVIVAQAKASADGRAKAQAAALAQAKSAKADAQKKAALSALSRTATAAADPTKPANTTQAAAATGTATAATADASARTGSASTANASGWTCAIAGCGGNFTSGYGYRSEFGAMHLGDDFSVSVGTPLHALHTGTVVATGWYGGMGNRVEIDFGNGVSAVYAHMSSITASVGQQVGAGEVIGYSGNTGHSTGPHLHLEIHLNGVPVNPQPWLRAHGIF